MSRYEMASIVARAVENSKEADLKTRGLVEMIRAAEHVDFYATDENENIARQAASNLADCVLLSGSAERVEVLGYRIWWVCAEYVVDMLMAAMIVQNGLKNICRRSKWLKENFVL